MFSFFNDINNYEARKVNRKTLENGLTVSTAYTSDEGYETAILDASGAHPVERYGSKEDAQKGHEKWEEFAKDGIGKEITKLGWLDDLVDSETIILEGDK